MTRTYIIENNKGYFVRKIDEEIKSVSFTYEISEALQFGTFQEAWDTIAKYHIQFCTVYGMVMGE